MSINERQLLKLAAQKDQPVDARMEALRALGVATSKEALELLLQAAVDSELPTVVSEAAASSLAEVAFRRSEVEAIPLFDMPDAAYLAFDAALARLLTKT